MRDFECRQGDVWKDLFQISLHIWWYEGLNIVEDLAVVPQGGIRGQVIAEKAFIFHCDKAIVRVTWVCPIGKLIGPEIMVPQIKISQQGLDIKTL